MMETDLEDKESNTFKKSIGYLQISTGIFHLSLSIIYWIIFLPVSAILDYISKSLDLGLNASLIITVVNFIVVFIMIINIFNVILGVINGMDYFKTKNLKLISKLVAIMTLLIFPIGTITGWVVLKYKI